MFRAIVDWGVPQNLVEAAYWYQRAAAQGDPDAQYLLGVSTEPLARGVADANRGV
jgi:TPR repeat protein